MDANGHSGLGAHAIQVNATPAADRTAYGADLLPADYGRDREAVLDLLVAAYQSVMGKGLPDWKLWTQARRAVRQAVVRNFDAAGFEAPPWHWDAFLHAITPRLPMADGIAHVSLIEALLKPYNHRVEAQFDYRHEWGGNVHIDFAGGTGLGKSSGAVGLADHVKTIKAGSLVDHLCFDVGELPQKLHGKQPRDSAIVDEYLQTAGEGSRTMGSLFQNLEDTLRASQINLFVLSPRRQEHGTMQATLEVIAWNPEKKYSVFLVWVGNQPMGIAALPWMREDLWDAYSPWKAANVERSKAAAFKDTKHLARAVVACFDDERFVQYLTEAVNKPKKIDFETAMQFFIPAMLSGQQAGRVVDLMYALCYGYERLRDRFEEWFGVKPNEGLETVAKKCYKE